MKERLDAEITDRKLTAERYRALRDKAMEQMARVGCRAHNDPERVISNLEVVGTWGVNLSLAANRVLDAFGLPRPATVGQLPNSLWGAADFCGRLRDAAHDLLGHLEIPLIAGPALLPDQLRLSISKVVAEVKRALVRGVHETLTLFGAHFDDVAFPEVVAGFPDTYTQDDLDKIRRDTKEHADQFANAMAPDTDAEGRPVEHAADP